MTSLCRPLQFLPIVAFWSYDRSYPSRRSNISVTATFLWPMVATSLWWSPTVSVVSGRQPVLINPSVTVPLSLKPYITHVCIEYTALKNAL